MFSIGELSRMARVSRRLLRYYEQRGLLRPAHVDSRTGYRYYGASEIAHLQRVLALKELGFSLERIAQAVKADLSAETFRTLLLERRNEVSDELSRNAEQLQRIDARLTQLEAGGAAPPGDVRIRPEPAYQLLSLRQRVDSFDAARSQIAVLRNSVPVQVPPRTLGPLLAIVHSPEFEPDDIDVELGYVLKAPTERAVQLPDGRLVQVRRVDAVEAMAVCVRQGPPEAAHAATEAIALHVEACGYRLAGPNRELFLRLPQPGDPSSTVVEMQFPVEPRPQRTAAERSSRRSAPPRRRSTGCAG